MYYERDGCKLVFFHIPRTGGRWVQWFLRENHFKFRLFDNIPDVDLGFQLLHLPKFIVEQHYPQYDIDNQFTIVRDPIDRFLSGIGYHEVNNLFELSQMSDQEFKLHLDKVISSDQKKTQILLPQHLYVDDKVRTHKYENGLGEPLKQFLQDTFNIPSCRNMRELNDRPGFNSNRDPQSLSKHRHLMPAKLLDNIISYYERDYEIFGYEPTRYP